MQSSTAASYSPDLLRRIVGEFMEMPGLGLTSLQATRLWGLDEPTCARLLDELVERKFLVRRGDARFTRRADGNLPQATLRIVHSSPTPKPPSRARTAALSQHRRYWKPLLAAAGVVVSVIVRRMLS